MPIDPRRARELFLHAVGKLPPEQWNAYLAEACGADAELKGHVLHLLEVHREAGSFLERPAAGVAAAGVAATGVFTPTPEAVATAAPPEPAVTAVGPYKLIEALGEGGMGTVWMAQQTAPVKRLVALKVIKAGMDSRHVLARFEAERQALALMDHPHIARVFDGGTTAAGRPYFVMELVQGVPITRYCDEHRLTPKQRLELFIPVCQAIQHAHQKGVIHRDIKPSNVLVALYDGKPVPKVIDFGIAKAAGQPLTEQTLVTGFGNVVGTLEYMSPEQAELNQLDIDTRSDVYSLGVLLYELLTGSTPLEKKRLKEAALLEVLRVIREEEPPRPSVRLSSTTEMPSIAANRGLEPRQLSGLVRGELDWLVMKALEKDRGRRYDSANGFAMDVQRYLADEPVLACPPSAAYRLRKFARRNRAALAVAGLVLFFLAALGGVAAWAAKDRADRRHEAAVQEAARRAALEADVGRDLDEARAFCRQDRLREAATVVAHAEALVARAEAGGELGRRVAQARADVDLAARLEAIRLEGFPTKDKKALDNKEGDARYRDAFRDYGLDVTALDADEGARRIQGSAIEAQQLAALGHWQMVKLVGRLPGRDRLLAVLRRAERDPWRARLRDAFERGDRTALKELARDLKAAAQPAAAVEQLAVALLAYGERPLAVAVLRSAQQQHPDDFWINHKLALELVDSGPAEAGEAVRYCQAALALRPDSPDMHTNLGHALHGQGDWAGAAAEFRKALELRPDQAVAHYNLGGTLRHLGDPAGAAAECRKAIALQPEYAPAHNSLGAALADLGDFAGAAAEFQKAIALRPNYCMAHCNLGSALANLGDPVGAAAECRRAIELQPDYADAHNSLGAVLSGQGDLAGAVTELRKALDLDPKNAAAHHNMGDVLAHQGDLAGAIAEYGKVLGLNPKNAAAHHDLGRALARQGDWAGAAAEFRKVLELKPNRAAPRTCLGFALLRQGDWAGAVAEFRKGFALPPAPAVRDEKDQRTFRVTAVSLRADHENYSGPGPHIIRFRGKITATGPGTVRYTFLRSDGNPLRVLFLTFENAGVQEVEDSWGIGRTYEGWYALKVLAPNEVTSEKARFKVECTK